MLEPSFETPLAHLSRPIRKKFRNACPLPSLSLWVREDMKSMPSVWGAAWKMIAEMKGLESIKVFLVHTNFRGLWSETVGTTLEDGYWGETTKMKSEKFIMKPLAQTAEILGDGVKMEVNTDWVKSENEQWNEGLFGVKRWKWVLYVGPEKCRFRLKHYE
jgi:hypothetical protein